MSGTDTPENPRITAKTVRTPDGRVITEYESQGSIYGSIEDLEAALGGV